LPMRPSRVNGMFVAVPQIRPNLPALTRMTPIKPNWHWRD
jgi:hypothetical protein